MKKRWLAAAFAAVAAGCLLTGSLVSAGAETPAEQPGTFAFVNGASVRYSVPTGLRFTVQMDAATYTGLVEEGAYKDGRSMSVYIAPADYFEQAGGDFAAVAERAVEAEIGADKIYQNAEEYGSEIYLANAVLTNVLYENVNREFQAIAAIESADADPVWSEPSDVRSVAYVASAALTEEETDETQSAVLNGFVQKAIAEADGVAEGEFNEDGSYEVAVSMESELFLEPEGSGTLALSVSPAADLYVKWTSDNPDVATVDKSGKVTAVSEGIANITAEAYGKTATCAVTVQKFKNFGYIDFSEYEIGDTEIAGFSAALGDIEADSYSVVEEGGEKVLKFEYTTAQNNAWVNMIYSSEILGDFSDFDYVDMEMKIVASGNGGGASLGPGYSRPNGITGGEVLNYKTGQWATYTWALDTVLSSGTLTIAEDMKAAGRMLFTMNPWAAQTVTVYVKSITGYYGALEFGETALDLTEEFRLSAEEFSAVFVSDDGTETPVADVTNFAPEQPGILTVSIAKQGYHPAEIAIRVTRKPDYGKLDFSDYAVGDQPDFFSASYGQGSGSYSIAEDDEGKYLKVEAQTTAINQKLIYKFVGDRFGVFGDFDYVDVTLQITVSDNGGDGGLTGEWARYDGFVSGTNYLTESKGSWVTYRWSAETILEAIKNNNSLDLYFLPWAAQSVTVGIRKIEAGWNDITSDGATAIDLAEKFGSGLTQAVYTPADGEAQTLTGDSLKTFIGEESGTLKLTFEVDGYRATEFTVNYTVA